MDEFTFNGYKANVGAATPLESSGGGETVPLLTPDREIPYGIATTSPPRVFIQMPLHLGGVGKAYPQPYARSAIGDEGGFTSATSTDANLGVPVGNGVELHQITIDGRLAQGADSDFDGIANLDEFTNSSNPNDADTDGDRILDGDEGIGNLTQIEGADPTIVSEPSLSVTFVYEPDPVLGLISIPTRIDLVATVHVADNAAVQSVTIEVVGQGKKTSRLSSSDGLRTATATATFGFEWFSSFVDGYDVVVVVADVNGNGITADSHVDGLAEGVVKAFIAGVTGFVESVKELASAAWDWILAVAQNTFNQVITPLIEAIADIVLEILRDLILLAAGIVQETASLVTVENLALLSIGGLLASRLIVLIGVLIGAFLVIEFVLAPYKGVIAGIATTLSLVLKPLLIVALALSLVPTLIPSDATESPADAIVNGFVPMGAKIADLILSSAITIAGVVLTYIFVREFAFRGLPIVNVLTDIVLSFLSMAISFVKALIVPRIVTNQLQQLVANLILSVIALTIALAKQLKFIPDPFGATKELFPFIVLVGELSKFLSLATAAAALIRDIEILILAYVV